MVSIVYGGDPGETGIAKLGVIGEDNDLLGGTDHELFQLDLQLVGVGQALFDAQAFAREKGLINMVLGHRPLGDGPDKADRGLPEGAAGPDRDDPWTSQSSNKTWMELVRTVRPLMW